MTHEHVEAHVI